MCCRREEVGVEHDDFYWGSKAIRSIGTNKVCRDQI